MALELDPFTLVAYIRYAITINTATAFTLCVTHRKKHE